MRLDNHSIFILVICILIPIQSVQGSVSSTECNTPLDEFYNQPPPYRPQVNNLGCSAGLHFSRFLSLLRRCLRPSHNQHFIALQGARSHQEDINPRGHLTDREYEILYARFRESFRPKHSESPNTPFIIDGGMHFGNNLNHRMELRGGSSFGFLTGRRIGIPLCNEIHQTATIDLSSMSENIFSSLTTSNTLDSLNQEVVNPLSIGTSDTTSNFQKPDDSTPPHTLTKTSSVVNSKSRFTKSSIQKISDCTTSKLYSKSCDPKGLQNSDDRFKCQLYSQPHFNLIDRLNTPSSHLNPAYSSHSKLEYEKKTIEKCSNDKDNHDNFDSAKNSNFFEEIAKKLMGPLLGLQSKQNPYTFSASNDKSHRESVSREGASPSSLRVLANALRVKKRAFKDVRFVTMPFVETPQHWDDPRNFLREAILRRMNPGLIEWMIRNGIHLGHVISLKNIGLFMEALRSCDRDLMVSILEADNQERSSSLSRLGQPQKSNFYQFSSGKTQLFHPIDRNEYMHDKKKDLEQPQDHAGIQEDNRATLENDGSTPSTKFPMILRTFEEDLRADVFTAVVNKTDKKKLNSDSIRLYKYQMLETDIERNFVDAPFPDDYPKTIPRLDDVSEEFFKPDFCPQDTQILSAKDDLCDDQLAGSAGQNSSSSSSRLPANVEPGFSDENTQHHRVDDDDLEQKPPKYMSSHSSHTLDFSNQGQIEEVANFDNSDRRPPSRARDRPSNSSTNESQRRNRNRLHQLGFGMAPILESPFEDQDDESVNLNNNDSTESSIPNTEVHLHGILDLYDSEDHPSGGSIDLDDLSAEEIRFIHDQSCIIMSEMGSSIDTHDGDLL